MGGNNSDAADLGFQICQYESAMHLITMYLADKKGVVSVVGLCVTLNLNGY